MSKLTLNNIGILVTRPAHQAEQLCHEISRQGGRPILFPTIEVAAPEDSLALEDGIKKLSSADIVIFVSANAVHKAIPHIQKKWPRLPAQLRIAAIGQATSNCLDELGYTADICPTEDFSSKGLLCHYELTNVREKHIVIMRGEGGRKILANTLMSRGATLTEVVCYRRVIPNHDPKPIISQMGGGLISLVISTSGESLKNFYQLIGNEGQQYMHNISMLIISERMAEIAKQLGYPLQPIIADEASDQGLLSALQKWQQNRK